MFICPWVNLQSARDASGRTAGREPLDVVFGLDLTPTSSVTPVSFDPSSDSIGALIYDAVGDAGKSANFADFGFSAIPLRVQSLLRALGR